MEPTVLPARGDATLAVATAGLAVTQLAWVLASPNPTDYLSVLSAATGVAALAAAAGIWLRDVFGARMTALGLALGSIASAVLVGTLGVPGAAPAWPASGAARLFLGIAVVLLLARAARIRRGRTSDPYAV